MEQKFRALAERISNVVGTSWSFITAMALVLLWIVTGPLFHFSDTWQLIINTGTTIVTFLMVFLIQNTQNRDAVAVQLKLDELLRAMEGARTQMVNLDTLSDTELGHLKEQFKQMGERAGSRELHREAGVGAASEAKDTDPTAAQQGLRAAEAGAERGSS